MKTKLLTLAICMVAQSLLNLAYAYHPVSPYAYALNNPVRFIDPNGMEIAESSWKEWKQQKATIQRNVDRMQTRMDKLVSKGASESRITNLGERIAGVNYTLRTMGQLEASTQVYALSRLDPSELGGLSYNNNTGVITISYSGTANLYMRSPTEDSSKLEISHLA